MAANLTTYCLENITDYVAFESLCTDLMACLDYTQIEPLGGSKDLGRDAIHVDKSRGTTVFAYSVREDWRRKLREDVERIRKTCPDAKHIVFLTTARISTLQRDAALDCFARGSRPDLELFGLERLRVLIDALFPHVKNNHPQIFSISHSVEQPNGRLRILMVIEGHTVYETFAKEHLQGIYQVAEEEGTEMSVTLMRFPTAVQLASKLLEGYDILHIVAMVERDGTLRYFGPDGMSPLELSDALRGKGVNLVLMTSCNSLNTARALEAADIPALISTSNPLTGITEASFSYTLYSGLAQGKSIKHAFQLASDRYLLERKNWRFEQFACGYHDFYLQCKDDSMTLVDRGCSDS